VGLCVLIGYLESMHVAVLYPILNASLDLGSALRDNPFLTVLYSLAELFPIDNAIISSCTIFIILTVLIFIFRYLYINLSVKTTAKLSVEYKRKVFNKFTQSDYQFFVDSRQGDLLYKAKGAPESIAASFDELTTSVVEVVVGISLLALLVSISWKGTILVLLGAVIYYYFTRYLGFRIAYVAGREMKASSQEENVVINEYISGIKQILTARNATQWTERFNKAILSRWRAWARNKIWIEMPPRVMELLLYSGIAIVAIAILIVYSDSFYYMIPMLGTFAYAIFRFYPRLSTTGRQLMQILNNLPNLEATYELLKDTTYSKIKNGTKEFAGLQSVIVFKNISFTYSNKNRATVSNVSLTIKKNRMTAIVGPSGAGKSTLVNLFLRLYDVDDGAILIDDVDLRDYELSSFLDRVGFVSQETFIYNASVKDNIVFGGQYSLDEIVQSAKSANAHDFIRQLPQGYDTIVGDQGAKLSGGERQRIAIARAMIRKPQILVLDEATSALDNISERVVQKAIDRVSEGCTTMVVAHRLSTIRRADMIYVIDNGRVVESGKHQELIKRTGKYSALYSTQEEASQK
jgi:ABC-type multidrug transport system fused ATPase/permease subunit